MASLIPLTLACLIFSAATESGLTGVTSIDVPREFFIFGPSALENLQICPQLQSSSPVIILLFALAPFVAKSERDLVRA
jgi:hypothetical protein